MVKHQQPQALGAINGDSYLFPDIRYANDIEMARGPMVRAGRVIRGTTKRQRVVGIDTSTCACEQPMTNGLAFLAGS